MSDNVMEAAGTPGREAERPTWFSAEPGPPGMTRERFAAYIEAFNSQDPDRFALEFFDPDITFERRDRRFTRGRDQYVAEYRASHDGLLEILRPQRVLFDGESIAMEVNVDFVAEKDQPDFIILPMSAGESIVVKLGVFYTVRDGRITYVKSFRWNPGQQ
ncbi:nuclear transport factor 2 family protein [Streptomyces sp. NBC_00988]|uniref:nuclear transport factor 2 family protein n=1 Tax=Streptomyces sp. NBC_00988 TaxID=2903704 RepID=UPI003867C272|nr:nuclear transport factor 2 family protein [Streptomyces sp. NBC_00988]